MTKPQYLAELDRLLIFMTGADREKALSRIGSLFDKAGPAGTDTLLVKLGSPTSEAIRLSRIYTAGGYTDPLLDSLERETGPAPEAPSAVAPESGEAAPAPGPAETPAYDVPPLIMDDLPGYEPPDIPDSFEADDPAGPKDVPAEPAAEPAPEPRPAPDTDMPDWISAPEEPSGESAPEQTSPEPPVPAAEKAPSPQAETETAPEAETAAEAETEQASPDEGPLYTVERSMPLWAGVPLFILSLVVLALPLGLVCLALIPVLVLPGVALLLGAWLAAVGGLWCISYIADAVMLFGLALVILAAALVALWLGLWLLVALWSAYCRALRGVTHLTLGKKVEVRA